MNEELKNKLESRLRSDDSIFSKRQKFREGYLAAVYDVTEMLGEFDEQHSEMMKKLRGEK